MRMKSIGGRICKFRLLDLIEALGCKVRSFFIGKSNKERLKTLNFAYFTKNSLGKVFLFRKKYVSLYQ